MKAGNRREFLKKSGLTLMGMGLLPSLMANQRILMDENPFFNISLAQWSLHNALFDKEMTNLDFPVRTKNEFGIDAVEYVSVFFNSTTDKYVNELRRICLDNDVDSVLIMVDNEGNMGANDERERIKAVENHYKWIEAAKLLGCQSIRVNARGEGTREEVAKAAVDGLGKLTEYGSTEGINVIVENHGGYSSDGEWLTGVIKEVGSPYCGTLPDFGNFKISDGNMYDRYKGVKELLPYAKGVSAKSNVFNNEGDEINTDYYKMMKIVKDGGYRGYVGIEYEGSELSEADGIMATRALLLKVAEQL